MWNIRRRCVCLFTNPHLRSVDIRGKLEIHEVTLLPLLLKPCLQMIEPLEISSLNFQLYTHKIDNLCKNF